MKTKLLIPIFLLSTIISYAQAGNTLLEAIELTDENTITLTNAFNGLTASAMTPHCFGDNLTPKTDLFYFNTIEATHDVVTFTMNSQIGVVARIYFQINRAAGGDVNNLTEVVCSFYDINIPSGGSMDIELPFASYPLGVVNPGDTYYLRIFSPTDQLGVDLDQTTVDAILSSTTVNITSLNSSTLSTVDFNETKTKFLVSKAKIEVINNEAFTNFQIYSIDGKRVNTLQSNALVKEIDIQSLSNGLYILNLSGSNSEKTIKFIKQ